MSERASAALDAPPGQAPSAAALSAGAILRQARENAGLHIGALAVSLKVPVKKLEALEADQLELLPDAVFARALAASVCRTLKLDPDPVLRLLPGQATPRLQLDPKVSGASFDTPSMGWRLPLLTRLSRPVVVTASLLLVAALVMLLVPWLERMRPAPTPAKLPAAAGAANVSRPVPAPAAAPAVVLNAAPPSLAASAAAPPRVPADAASAPPPLAGAAIMQAGSRVVAAPAAQDNEALAPGAGLVVFKARGSSWVEVTDAGGVVRLRKTMGSGETAGASGALPLSVTVGRADSTEVLVRGKSLDLAPLARDNVARFQVR